MDVRRSELQLRRELDRAQKDNDYLKTVIQDHCQSVKKLEEEKVRALEEFERQQIRWEERESQLER